jgi:Protein of unknown function (DUF2742)
VSNRSAPEPRAFTGAGFLPSQQVSWVTVLEFVERCGVDPTTVLLAGTPTWNQLPDDHPDKLGAVLAGGVHHAVRIDGAQAERADASRAISAVPDWRTRPRGRSYIPRRKEIA